MKKIDWKITGVYALSRLYFLLFVCALVFTGLAVGTAISSWNSFAHGEKLGSIMVVVDCIALTTLISWLALDRIARLRELLEESVRRENNKAGR